MLLMRFSQSFVWENNTNVWKTFFLVPRLTKRKGVKNGI